MEFLNNITKPSIFICNYSYKDAILKKVSKEKLILPIKFMTIDELISLYFFDYDEKTISYCMEKYNFSYEIALMYIKNLYYIKDDCDYEGPLKFLMSLKKDLLANNLLYFNDKSFLLKNDFYFIGMPYLKKIEEYIVDRLKKDVYVEVIPMFNDIYNPVVYEASTILEEVSFVAIKICELLDKGISFDKIKITNLDIDYTYPLKRVFSSFNIPISFNNSFYGLDITNDFLNLYDDNSLEDIFLLLNEKYPKNKDLINKLINICNKYVLVSNKEIKKEFIVNSLKNSNVMSGDSIEVCSYLNDFFSDDDYVFLLNFNQNVVPKMTKDEDYITDSFKDNTLLDLTVDLNKKIKKTTLAKLRSIKNLTITYKLSTPFRTFYPSSLKDEFENKTIDINYNISYSKRFIKETLAKDLDNFIKFGISSPNLSLLYSNNKDIEYKTYKNDYTLIKSNIKEIDEYNLSYSSMDNFYKCPFRYYLSNILGLDIFEDSFASMLGSLFHYVLQYHFKDNLDVDYLVKKFLEDKNINSKDLFFINKLKPELNFIIDTIKKQYEEMSLDSTLYEKRILIPLKENKIYFKGFVDKILYKSFDDYTVISIIDYKTGNVSLDLSLCNYGLNMQLPVYLYLVNKDKSFSKIKFAGFYLQRILFDVPLKDENKSLAEKKKDNLKLVGYSNSNEEILHIFDRSYKESRVVKSLSVKKDGNFNHFAKILSDKDINNLISLTESKIEDAVDGISKKNYVIAPKRVNDLNLSCTFCKFRDICFRKEEDFVDIKIEGGDDNA